MLVPSRKALAFEKFWPAGKLRDSVGDAREQLAFTPYLSTIMPGYLAYTKPSEETKVRSTNGVAGDANTDCFAQERIVKAVDIVRVRVH